MITIAYDPKIPFIPAVFADSANLIALDIENLAPEHLHHVDVLIARTSLKINAQLLEGSAIKAVCTTSSGIDHIDLAYCQAHAIQIFHAKGCNASAVADYVLAAYYALREPRAHSIGIIGLGHVGQRVYRRFSALGHSCYAYDPLLTDAPYPLSTLSHVLNCEIVTLHVPYTTTGLFPTHGMLNNNELQRLANRALLINTARGGVVDESALLKFANHREDLQLAFDVWKNEPDINAQLAKRCDIASPHIAGWSLSARLRAVLHVAQQLQQHFALTQLHSPQLPATPYPIQATTNHDQVLTSLLKDCVDLQTLSQQFKQGLQASPSANTFKSAQAKYIYRRELTDYAFNTDDAATRHWLSGLLQY